MERMLNIEVQQVNHNVSSSQQKPLTSSYGDNNKDGEQSAAVAIQNVEEAPPTSGDNATQVQGQNHNVSSSQPKPLTSSNGDNNKDGEQSAAVAIQNVEEAPPTSGDNATQVQGPNHNVSSSQQKPLTSTYGDNNKDGEQSAAVAIQNVEEAPPTSGDNATQVQGPNQRLKINHHTRHTQHQIEVMENFFKEYHHPNEEQRRELGNSLGLNSTQVKFWFQNKRSQMKVK
ncbi:homeobox-leucine zipper protein ROC1-like [Lotus japonicus]|uniref:homeobox-leucine zipper protein ROC1-like n=1 Tax=Lotus japonicus TaxID=34305 RepID=UPI00258E7BC3|nr:homeobox-leucine zipper protein ROC1-like [Lotus japonicus]